MLYYIIFTHIYIYIYIQYVVLPRLCTVAISCRCIHIDSFPWRADGIIYIYIYIYTLLYIYIYIYINIHIYTYQLIKPYHIYIYIYIYTVCLIYNYGVRPVHTVRSHDTGVCKKETPPEKKTCEHISLENTQSGAGEQFLLLDCRARACAKGVLISQTPVWYGIQAGLQSQKGGSDRNRTVIEPIKTETFTPGPHNKNPRHKIFAKGWVAQKHIFDRYLDGCAKIFQDFPRVGSEKTGIF